MTAASSDVAAGGFPPEVETFLSRAHIPLRLATVDAQGWPRVASLWFLVEEGSLWCATRGNARVVSDLRLQPRCAAEIATHVPPYSGVRVKARAHLVAERGEEILGRLIDRYLGSREGKLAEWLLARASDEMALRIDPVSVSRWDFSDRMGGQGLLHA